MHNRLAFVDALRGIAVLAVLLQHLLEQIILSGTAGTYYWTLHNITGYYFNFGRFGVVLFFFVSGFVIPYSFPASASPVKDFTISRLFRLYPMYWLSVVVAVLLAPVIEGKSYPAWQIVVNLSMFQMFVNVANIRIAYWSLAIELIFYISCCVVFAAGFLNRPMTAVCMVISASIVGIFAPMVVPYWIVWRLMEVVLNLTAMFLGKVTRDTMINRQLNPWLLFACVALYCTFACSIAFKLYGGEYQENFFHSYSIASAYVAAATVFLAFAISGEGRRWRILAFVGVISYSIYLMHAYVMSLALYFIGTGSTPAQWLPFVLGVVLASILVSSVTYTLLEKPAIAFGRRFRSGSTRSMIADPRLLGEISKPS
jgi:peptidoglycan/LPS O-acetylase OafA/YrhL